MKIVHIFPYEKFTEDYIRFIREHFNISEHFFVIPGSYEGVTIHLPEDGNILFKRTKTSVLFDPQIRRLIREADRLLIHSALGCEKISYYCGRAAMAKTVLVMWGADIYEFRNKIPLWNIIEKRKRKRKKTVIRRALGIAVLAKGDYGILRSFCRTESGYFPAVYPFSAEAYRKMQKIKKEAKCREPIKILVGNSASVENQHMEALKLLSRFREEPVRILCPLSYGDQDNARRVKAFGESLFGDKFIALTDFMPIERYNELLAQCHIGIFNNNRQQALGNITALAYYGAKLYLRDDTSMWEELNGERGYRLFPIETISRMDFREFTSMEEEDRKENESVFAEYAEGQKVMDLWSTIFGGESGCGTGNGL